MKHEFWHEATINLALQCNHPHTHEKNKQTNKQKKQSNNLETTVLQNQEALKSSTVEHAFTHETW